MLDPLSTKNTPCAEAAPYATHDQQQASLPPVRKSASHKQQQLQQQPLDNAQPISMGSLCASALFTLLCPFLPAAQVASSVGKSFLLSLMAFAALYVSGGVAYAVAASVDHSFVVAHNPLTVYGAQIIMFLCGPFASTLVAFYHYSNTKWSSGMGTMVSDVGKLNEEMNAKMHVNGVAVVMVAINILLQLVFAIGLWKLRSLVNKRIKINTGDDMGCRDAAVVLCCVSCSLFETIWAVRDTSKTPPCHMGAIDELPAFEFDDATKKANKKANQVPPV